MDKIEEIKKPEIIVAFAEYENNDRLCRTKLGNVYFVEHIEGKYGGCETKIAFENTARDFRKLVKTIKESGLVPTAFIKQRNNEIKNYIGNVHVK